MDPYFQKVNGLIISIHIPYSIYAACYYALQMIFLQLNVHRMHCKIVFNFALRHDLAL